MSQIAAELRADKGGTPLPRRIDDEIVAIVEWVQSGRSIRTEVASAHCAIHQLGAPENNRLNSRPIPMSYWPEELNLWMKYGHQQNQADHAGEYRSTFHSPLLRGLSRA